LDNGKKAKSPPLAPIKTKILISRGSAYKIEVNSGTLFPKMPNVYALKIKKIPLISEGYHSIKYF